MSLKEDLQTQTQEYNERMKKIDFQVDTLGVTNSTSLGYYSPGRNTITMNYHEADEWLLQQEKAGREGTLYHEQKHRSNANKGFKSASINVSPEQYFKLCQADEISANMAELIYLREEYIKTKDINVFGKDGKRFYFYKKAVQSGEINPLSSDPKEFEKDMSLIVNGTRDMWMMRFKQMYEDTHRSMMFGYMKKHKWYMKNHKGSFEENDTEYQKQLDIAYTIGGINFKQYMQKSKYEEYKSWGEINVARISRMAQLQFKDNMSFEQYNNLLQHAYVASRIKELISYDYIEYLKKHPERYKKEIPELVQSLAKSAKEEMASDEVKTAVNCCLNQALGKDGDRISIPDEDKAHYEDSLKQIYNVWGIDCYSLLNIDSEEKMPIEKTEEVKNFENKNIFSRVRNKARAKCAEITDKFKKKEEKKEENKKEDSHEYLKNYPKWSKNKRVSEIQYAEILDLDKNVITRPAAMSQSYQQNVTSIPLQEVTSSYNRDQLKSLCSDPVRWNKGRKCNAEQYSKAANITGLPAELIAYVYEVNRRNFPAQSDLAKNVMNTSTLSDKDISQSVADILSRYSIEKGNFFGLKKSSEIKSDLEMKKRLKMLSGRDQNYSSVRTPSFAKIRNYSTGIDAMMYNRQKAGR